MALPTYDKSKRTKQFKALPKGAYVIKILSAKEVQNANKNGSHLAFAFDIAEGEYKDFYKGQFDRNTSEDKKWPIDAIFYLTIPHDGCADYVVTNYDSFFADLEDSNNGFVFSGDEKALKGKVIGAKMHIRQTEYNGKVYDHTRMKWSCVADDVRKGKAGRLPNDKLVDSSGTSGNGSSADSHASGGFSNSDDDEIPFD